MNYNQSEIFRSAETTVSKSTSFTFVLAKLLVPRKKRPIFYCWYAYLRWVDDIADSDKIPVDNRISFIANQINNVEYLYTGKNLVIDAELTGEVFLRELVKYDIKNGIIIKKHIINMLNCILFDVTRGRTLSTSSNIEYYFNVEVLAYLNAFQFFCTTPKRFREIVYSKEGYAGKWVHVIRDFIIDMEEGIFNLPLEDCQKYGFPSDIDTSIIHSENFIAWVRSKCSEISANFKEGKNLIHKHPSIKYKILVILLCFKYQLILKEIISNKFILRQKFVIRKRNIAYSTPNVICELVFIIISHPLNSLRRHNILPNT